MAPGVRSDGTGHCSQHTQNCERLKDLEAFTRHVQPKIEELDRQQSDIIGKLHELKGNVDRDYPQFRESIGKLFVMIEEKIKTDEMYQVHFRQMARDVEALDESNSQKADRAIVDAHMTTLATKESVDGLRFRLQIGWVTLTATILLMLIGVILKVLGYT